jgi:hypothetical protein
MKENIKNEKNEEMEKIKACYRRCHVLGNPSNVM